MENYITVREAAALWNVSERLVRRYCTQGRIANARQEGRGWLIPVHATKPETGYEPEIQYPPRLKRILYQLARNNHCHKHQSELVHDL